MVEQLFEVGIAVFIVGIFLCWIDSKFGLPAILTGLILLGVFVFMMGVELALARDPDGRYADNPLKPWFDGLRSGEGPCCSDADGNVVIDGDWETSGDHYRVKVRGVWIDVPDDAVLKEPNRDGRTIVWPIFGPNGVIMIRCFIPGSMT